MGKDRTGAGHLEAAAVQRARRQQKRGRKRQQRRGGRRQQSPATPAGQKSARTELRVVTPLDDLAATQEISVANKDAVRKRDTAARQRPVTASVTATEAAPATSASSARRAPKRAQPLPPQSVPEKTTARPRGRQLPLRPSERPETSRRKYPTLAQAHSSTPAITRPEEPVTPEPRPQPIARATAEIRRDKRVGQAAPEPEASIDTGTVEKPPVARAPRPTVALRRSSTTRRLAASDLLSAQDDLRVDSAPAASAPAATTASRRLRSLPDVDVTVTSAAVHAGIATLAALTGATLLIADQSAAPWPLALALLAGAGGWLGYALAQSGHTRRGAGYALLASQLGMLAWLLVLVGPRAAVLSLAPIIVLLALRMSGRTAAVVATGGALALYLSMSALALTQVLRPAFSASPVALFLLDACLICIGALGTLAGVLDLRTRQMRAESAARARLYELRIQRSRVAELRLHVEDDAETLASALSEALRGQGIQAPHARGALSPLADPIAAAAERMATLQRDREDRLRLEAALRAVIHEVERAWLGLPWVWPRPSGTQLDELVALLRSPRPADSSSSWTSETPTLVPIPTLDTGPRAHVSAPGASGPDLSRFRMRAPVLPWSEWDEWSGWDPTRQQDGA